MAPEVQQRSSKTHIQSKAVPTFHTLRRVRHARFQSSSPCSIIHGGRNLFYIACFCSLECHSAVLLSRSRRYAWVELCSQAMLSQQFCHNNAYAVATMLSLHCNYDLVSLLRSINDFMYEWVAESVCKYNSVTLITWGICWISQLAFTAQRTLKDLEGFFRNAEGFL